jgi:hypothetical protein
MPNNPFFGAMGGGVPNVFQLLEQLKQNPAQVLAQRFRLPQNVSNPNDLLQHLIQSGQVSQQQVNAAYQQAQRMGFKR